MLTFHWTTTGFAAGISAVLSFGCADPGAVRVANPTGDRARDTRAITTAIDRAAPGDIVRFGPGTYLAGGNGILVGLPRVDLRGHSDGTTLMGCTPTERTSMPLEQFWETCNGFTLAGEAQRVSDIRFEGFNYALTIRQPDAVDLPEREVPFRGGHVIEDNVFQDVTSFSIRVDADSVIHVRRNVFRNTWHAVATGGRNVHIVDNDISVPEPRNVSNGYPGGAIGIRPNAGVCESFLVQGNRIDGHTEGVMVAIFPQDEPGSSCSDITVRDNEIIMRPIRLPEDDPRMGRDEGDDHAGMLSIAPAILIRNVQPLVGAGVIDWPAFWIPEGGWPPELADARIHNVTVEGNRITGAIGVGIEVVDVDDISIIDNEIDVRPATSPDEFQGLRLGGNGGAGVWVRIGMVDEVNGMPVWVSPDSHGVTVSGR